MNFQLPQPDDFDYYGNSSQDESRGSQGRQFFCIFGILTLISLFEVFACVCTFVLQFTFFVCIRCIHIVYNWWRKIVQERLIFFCLICFFSVCRVCR